MNDDRIKTLRAKLESSGLEKVKENLRHNRYASKWKISHIEDWVKERESPSVKLGTLSIELTIRVI